MRRQASAVNLVLRLNSVQLAWREMMCSARPRLSAHRRDTDLASMAGFQVSKVTLESTSTCPECSFAKTGNLPVDGPLRVPLEPIENSTEISRCDGENPFAFP
jgi:hypothetical protein